MSYKTTWRDRVAYRLANAVLNTLATREYRAYVSVVTAVGREELPKRLGWADEMDTKIQEMLKDPTEYFKKARENAR